MNSKTKALRTNLFGTKKTQANTRLIGSEKEQAALGFLKQRGYKLIEMNYLCRSGEIDLIVSNKKMLLFVEVRFRSSAQFGGAAVSVTTKKQNKLIKTAEHFLQSHEQYRCLPCRIDVIAITADELQWIENAVIQ